MASEIRDLAPPIASSGGDAVHKKETGGGAVPHDLGDVPFRRVGRVAIHHMNPHQRARAVLVIRNRRGPSSSCNSLVAATVTVGVIAFGFLVHAARGHLI